MTSVRPSAPPPAAQWAGSALPAPARRPSRGRDQRGHGCYVAAPPRRLRVLVVADIPDELIELERAAEEERAKLAGLDEEEREAQWKRWREATDKFEAAVTKHAEETGQSRDDVRKAARKAVRNAEEDPAE